jgi:RimJ/RimL family protein N-acetyltransferase
VRLRPAESGDADALAALMAAVDWLRDGAGDPPAARWREVIADDDWWVLVAHDDGGGLAGVVTVKPAEDLDGAGHISYLVVAPEHWGTGVAATLLAAAVDQMRDRGYERGQLRVVVDNHRARRFYERSGWRFTGHEAFHDELGLMLADYRLTL